MSKILIVDDNEQITRVLSSYAEHEGYDVDVALDGARAWKMFQVNNYDLVLLDIMLPHITNAEENLIKRTENVAAALEKNLDFLSSTEWQNPGVPNENRQVKGKRDTNERNFPEQRGFGVRRQAVELINSLISEEAWLFDRNASSLITGRDDFSEEIDDLPSDVTSIVAAVFQGQHLVTDVFSDSIGSATITAAAPIYDDTGEVFAVLLMHENKALFDELFNEYIFHFAIILFLTFIAVSFFAVFLAKSLAKPIQEISLQAQKISEGDYKSRLDIKSEPELNNLAENMNFLSERLAQNQLELEQENEIRQNILATLSHELRTPITVFKTSIEALQDGVVSETEEIAEYYETLAKEVELMENNIDQLEDLYSLESKAKQAEKTVINIIRPLSAAIKSQKYFAEEKLITVDFQVEDEEIILAGIEIRLQQLFTILLNNAIKYSDSPGVVSVKEKSTDQGYIISFHNYGQVIKEKDLDKIFVQFYRTEESITSGISGNGIGLALAKQIADFHKIKIIVDSDPKQGVYFTLFISDEHVIN
ncbi:MAG: hybrid sensor histidine kinase/response regulator [Clostridiaceae bacterium]|nr:hybrid sensor histidine kinase/response regulator [Clostridiaceae bacterium]